MTALLIRLREAIWQLSWTYHVTHRIDWSKQ